MNAIEVRNLGKMYRIGAEMQTEDSFVMAMWKAATTPVRRMRSVMTSQLPVAAEKEFWALKDLSFDVPVGEVMGVIGPNGAGKSTLLKILTRISAPTEGRVTLRGRVSSLLEVGTGFHQELTGRENVYMNGTILGMSRHEIRRKFDEIVAFSGVEEFIDTPVKRYSSGMQVRLAFSVAAHLEPEILLVDEVLAVGDAEFRRKCLGKMREVTGEGRTVVTVSHNMASIQNLCDSVMLLVGGRLVMLDATDRVVAEYLQRAYGGESEATSNLSLHAGRKSHMQPMLKQIRVLNGAGQPTPAIQVGQPIVFEVTLDSGGELLQSANLIIDVSNEYEQRVVRFNAGTQGGERLNIDGRHTVTCAWDDCILGPGNYSVDVTLRSLPQADRPASTVDQVMQAINFEVAAGDFYGSGRMIKDSAALIWPRVRWNVENGASTPAVAGPHDALGGSLE